jgi:hypothetical protein
MHEISSLNKTLFLKIDWVVDFEESAKNSRISFMSVNFNLKSIRTVEKQQH